MLDKNGQQEAVHMELSPKEFYELLHEMEKAKTNLQSLTGGRWTRQIFNSILVNYFYEWCFAKVVRRLLEILNVYVYSINIHCAYLYNV